MKSYQLKADFRRFAEDLSATERAKMRRDAEQRSPVNATFLSHSSKDDELVVGAIRILKNHGANVYVDKVDPEMPPYTTKETARLLKTRISQAKRFVLLATGNSKNSNWVPWELGIADSSKGLRNIALFPAVDARSDTSWTTWEYMGLYKRIIWGTIETGSPQWIVLDEDANTASPLGDWLRG
jgi:hypothetical protein